MAGHRYTGYYSEDARKLLDNLIDENTDFEEYRKSFRELGEILGDVVRKDILAGKIMIACAAEDADWLASGFMKGLAFSNVQIAVFWNSRVQIAENEKMGKIEISPIIKSYVSKVDNVDTIIIVKSIISTSCVVKTQLMRLLDTFNPEQIIVVAPVMYKDAELNLRNEFPENISKIMKYYALAIDDEKEGDRVIPGIGGMVYPRLGLGNSKEKNSYLPELVKMYLIV